MIQSSGTTAIATTDDNAVAVLANANSDLASEITIINGAVDGFWSADGGATWMRLPANTSDTLNLRHCPIAAVVKIKRIAGGSNMTGVFARMI